MSLLAPHPFYKTLCHLVCVCLTGKMQGWGFAHMFSEQIAHFLVSDLSDLLRITHFL